ncbi:aminopeptidase N [Enterovirga sp.]|uniref:aminopeptidase N n=1 Tax=Enterovirga sp. TaxID=2026350 RepID=UPI002613DEED|nr:aminopeptidase N [Enterovirga sp.]MDB5591375.1 aminopeptidase [Enterovirga sp.]
MRTDTAPVTRLADYRPSDYLVDTIELDIRLHPTATRITSVLAIRPNPCGVAGAALVLDGDELMLLGVELDGQRLDQAAFDCSSDKLTVFAPPPGPFRLTVRTEVNPTANTKLMGLYRSSGIYCTQCEADGFRRITYAIDRPDVMSVYTTRIEADRDEAPILLGNGNLVETGPVGERRHFALWHDPHPKPGYLFAVVGGRLAKIAKPFTTASGRPVEIAVFVEPGKESRAEYALDALERSMLWDERVFGREYDLDVFNVVAVSDFNMGAMENKGLNIFNDKYVLASPDTATDTDYAHIEAVIAHEYFHNWTGNRITCRDWFQLCLKEGLTVFRDQEFSSDERSRAVHRIGEVRTLRARQFPEDSGPLSHPVRPTQYREINNFYTATVYEKGAEIIRMLKTVLGEQPFAAGMTRYFERCDGTAATVEDFLDAFASVSGRDLSHFARWYEQAGTPTVTVRMEHDAATATCRLDFRQTTPPTPGQPDKAPLVIPVALGLVSESGGEIAAASPRLSPDGVFLLEREEDSLTLSGVTSRPVPSLFRGFSAPVKVKLDLPESDLLTLVRHDTDPFNRWQSAQTVALRLLVRLAGDESGRAGAEIAAYAAALATCLAAEADRDPAFAAVMLALPGEAEIAQEIGQDVDPDAVRRALDVVRRDVGRALAPSLREVRAGPAEGGRYSPDAASAGRRALRNAALDLLGAADPDEGARQAAQQFEAATNMTDRLAALGALALIPGPDREAAFAGFAARYAEEPLALDKWFALQATVPEATTLDRVRALMNHPGFAFSNPNRVRALVGSFALGNPTQFHRPDGAGYDFLADIVLALNGANPQVAARLLTAFSTWRLMEPGRRGQAQAALRRIKGADNLSPDVADIAARSLGET